MILTYMKASNDKSGNPRRGWLITDHPHLYFIVEGYEGEQALRDGLRRLGFDPTTQPTSTRQIRSGEYSNFLHLPDPAFRLREQDRHQ